MKIMLTPGVGDDPPQVKKDDRAQPYVEPVFEETGTRTLPTSPYNRGTEGANLEAAQIRQEKLRDELYKIEDELDDLAKGTEAWLARKEAKDALRGQLIDVEKDIKKMRSGSLAGDDMVRMSEKYRMDELKASGQR